MTNRREFLKIAGLTAAWPCAGAWAQAPGVLVNDLHAKAAARLSDGAELFGRLACSERGHHGEVG